VRQTLLGELSAPRPPIAVFKRATSNGREMREGWKGRMGKSEGRGKGERRGKGKGKGEDGEGP